MSGTVTPPGLACWVDVSRHHRRQLGGQATPHTSMPLTVTCYPQLFLTEHGEQKLPLLTRPSEPMQTRASGQARARVARHGRSVSRYDPWSRMVERAGRAHETRSHERRRFSGSRDVASDIREAVRGRSNLSSPIVFDRYNRICRTNDKSANVPLQAHWTAQCSLDCVRQLRPSDGDH
jgi:hypothetical protein